MNKTYADPLLIEVAWEVCNQVGGIYTVIRTKIPAMVEKWGDHYFAIGPYMKSTVASEFDPSEDYNNPVGQAVLKMRNMGFEVHYGVWLVTGRPKIVLFDPFSVYSRLNDIKYELWTHHQIGTMNADDLLNQVVAFGYMVRTFFSVLASPDITTQPIVAHFHEWMAAVALPGVRREQLNMTTVFTTHATLLGRYLAMNDPNFYTNLPHVNWEREAKHFNIDAAVRIERAAAHGSHVFTTVSDVTAIECMHLLGRQPDLIVPNGLNIERFVALHEFQNLHLQYKEKIHQFVMGHFFQTYKFDLDKTLYFFTSGRFEYRNKGFDLTLEALARLNWMMRLENMDTTVVMYFITKQPYYSINPAVLQSRAIMEEIRQTCQAIQKQVGERMFYEVATGTRPKLPPLNDFVDDYWKLRLRRTLQSWKKTHLPIVVTHNLVNDQGDEILNAIRQLNLLNNQHDRVKVVYHPDFISPSNPLFGMDYGQFVRGCHLGVFPSYYEPWGYTPLECIASGVPTVTSDLAGFGDYVMKNVQAPNESGIYVVERKNRSFDDAANQLADQMLAFVKQSRRDRITQRNRVESASTNFDWQKLRLYYDKAHLLALQRKYS